MINYTVNLSKIKTLYALHQELKDSLQFPDYYGMNWDAFWDCITSDIEIPATIYIEGINLMPKDLKGMGDKLVSILDRAVEWYKKINMNLKVIYKDAQETCDVK